jgi:hypothetical protein
MKPRAPKGKSDVTPEAADGRGNFPSHGEPLQFAVGGRITSVDPIRRSLQIGTRDCWVDPGVSMGGLAPGKTVTVTGYQDHGTGGWIVTRFTHG